MIDLDKMVADAQARLTKALDDDVSFHRTEARVVAIQLKEAQAKRHDEMEIELLGETLDVVQANREVVRELSIF